LSIEYLIKTSLKINKDPLLATYEGISKSPTK